jgi:hypothetical protein
MQRGRYDLSSMDDLDLDKRMIFRAAHQGAALSGGSAQPRP